MKKVSTLLFALATLLLSACATRTPEGYDAQLHPHRPDYIAVQSATAGAWVQQADGSSIYQASAPAAAPTPAAPQPDRSAVQVEVTQDGARAGIDILGIRNYRASDWARSAAGPLKILTYPVDYLAYMATNHPFQTLAAGLVLWEVTDDGVSSLFTSSSTTSAPTSDTRQDANISINGDNNNVTITTTTGTTAEAPRETRTTTTNN